MIVLNDSTESLVVTLGGANSHDFLVAHEVLSAGGRKNDGEPKEQNTNVAATTANTAILAAPATSTRKVVKKISVRNMTANSTTVAISKRVSTTNYAIGPTFTLASGESLVMDEEGRYTMYNATGTKKADA